MDFKSVIMFRAKRAAGRPVPAGRSAQKHLKIFLSKNPCRPESVALCAINAKPFAPEELLANPGAKAAFPVTTMTNASGATAAWKPVRKRPSALKGESSSGF